MAKVLIVGCGNIGQGLAEVLIAEGHQVSGIKRKPLARQSPGLELIVADITVADQLKGLPTDFDQVVLILTPDSRDEDSYRRVYLHGINNLLAHFSSAAIQEKPVPACLFVSSTSVYGQNAGQWVDEDSETEPTSATAKILLQAENNVLAHSPKNTIVRFSGIYGPGREGLIRQVQSGAPVQYEPPYYTNRIHQDDCVGVLAWLLKQSFAGTAIDNIYLASDDEPAAIKEVSDWLAEKLNCTAPAAKQIANPAQNKRCANQRLRAQGCKLRFASYRQGYAALLKSARQVTL